MAPTSTTIPGLAWPCIASSRALFAIRSERQTCSGVSGN